MRRCAESRYGKRVRTRVLIPPPHGLFLGKLDRSRRQTGRPAAASVLAAVAPAGPAPTTRMGVVGTAEPAECTELCTNVSGRTIYAKFPYKSRFFVTDPVASPAGLWDSEARSRLSTSCHERYLIAPADADEGQLRRAVLAALGVARPCGDDAGAARDCDEVRRAQRHAQETHPPREIVRRPARSAAAADPVWSVRHHGASAARRARQHGR